VFDKRTWQATPFGVVQRLDLRRYPLHQDAEAAQQAFTSGPTA
jgi:hypothetical protein